MRAAKKQNTHMYAMGAAARAAARASACVRSVSYSYVASHIMRVGEKVHFFFLLHFWNLHSRFRVENAIIFFIFFCTAYALH